MNNNEFIKKINKRNKNINLSDNLYNLLLLSLPTILIVGIVATTILLFSFIGLASLFLLILIYPVLPMFYTVIRRMEILVSNIGNKNYSFLDGYKDFFGNKQNGIFGLIFSISTFVLIIMALYLFFSNFLTLMCSPFPNALNVLNNLANEITNYNMEAILESIENDFVYLIKPFVIFVSTIMLIPHFYLFFNALNSNLSTHYLATIVLPDIDLNFSASQSRGIINSSVKRIIKRDVLKYRYQMNWIYYLTYLILYVVSTLIFVFIDYNQIDNIFISFLFIFATPLLSIFYGMLINYFCLKNELYIVEELTPIIHKLTPIPIKTSLQAVYKNPSYIHDKESEIRGAFFKEEFFVFNANENAINKLMKEITDNIVDTNSKKENINEKKEEGEINAGVFDFSKDNKIIVKDDTSAKITKPKRTRAKKEENKDD